MGGRSVACACGVVRTLGHSEERGEVSLCVRGKIHRNLEREELINELRTYYAQLEKDEQPQAETA